MTAPRCPDVPVGKWRRGGKWRSSIYNIATADPLRPALGPLRTTVMGLTSPCGCWGVRKTGARWEVTHMPTGMLMPGTSFRCLAEAKRFCEELSAEVNCRIGRFGSLKRARGVRAFTAAAIAKRLEYGFDPKPIRSLNEDGAIVYVPPRSQR